METSFYDHKKVARLVEESGIPKPQLAEKLGVSLMTVYRVERGTCSIELLAKIAIVLNVSLTELIHPAQVIAKNFSPAA